MKFYDRTLSRRSVLAGTVSATACASLAATSTAWAKAPMLGTHRDTYYRFKLGDFEITSIMDADAFIDGPWPLIGKNADEEDVKALMRRNLLPTNKYRPGFTPIVVNTGSQVILFDTGNGSKGFVPRPQGGWLAKQLAPAGFDPAQIDIVVLSHGHPDHIGGLFEDGKPLFPNARYVIGQIEYDFWSPEGKHSGDLEKFAQLFREYVVPLAPKTTFIKPGDDVVTGIRALAAYGHTPGHLAFHIESKNKQLLFWGDCAHHQVASLARPDWYCVFDVEQETAAKTRERMFDMVATDKLAVSAFHMPFPSFGFVQRLDGRGYRWIENSYQLEAL